MGHEVPGARSGSAPGNDKNAKRRPAGTLNFNQIAWVRPAQARTAGRRVPDDGIVAVPAGGVAKRCPGPEASAASLAPARTKRRISRRGTLRRAMGQVSAQGEGRSSCPPAGVFAHAVTRRSCATCALRWRQRPCQCFHEPPRGRGHDNGTGVIRIFTGTVPLAAGACRCRLSAIPSPEPDPGRRWRRCLEVRRTPSGTASLQAD